MIGHRPSVQILFAPESAGLTIVLAVPSAAEDVMPDGPYGSVLFRTGGTLLSDATSLTLAVCLPRDRRLSGLTDRLWLPSRAGLLRIYLIDGIRIAFRWCSQVFIHPIYASCRRLLSRLIPWLFGNDIVDRGGTATLGIVASAKDVPITVNGLGGIGGPGPSLMQPKPCTTAGLLLLP